MRGPSNAQYLTAAILTSLAVGSAHGGVIEFIEKEEWIAAVGGFTTIDFTGFEDGEFITEQYADLGVHFDGTDLFFFNPSFVNDSWGVNGNGSAYVSFDTPQAYIGFDYPGFLRIDLYSEGRLFFQSEILPGGGLGNFKGLVSTELFDAVRLVDPTGVAEIDDMHFGIPGPSGLYVLAIAALRSPRRCRRSSRPRFD